MSHGPGASERMAKLGKKGSAAVLRNRGKGLDPGELGPLNSHGDAQRWLRIAGEAVAVGRLTDRQGNAISKAVSEWVKAEAGRVREEDLAELQEQIRELKKRDLRVVK
ncbi:MAG: hypothetical protein ACREMD_12025 [Gemmatimonadota bacterium]